MARELTPEQIAEDRRRWKSQIAQRVQDTVEKSPKPAPPTVKPQRVQRVIQPAPAPKPPKEFPPGIVDIPSVRAKQDAARAAAKEELAARVESLSLDALTAGGPNSGWHGPPKGDHVASKVPGGEEDGSDGEKKPTKKEAAAKKKAAKGVYPLREARKEREALEEAKKDPTSKKFEVKPSTKLKDLPKDYYADDHFANKDDVDWDNGTVEHPYGPPPHPERKMTAEDRRTPASMAAARAAGRDDKIWGPEFDRKGRETVGGNRRLFDNDHGLNHADSERIIRGEKPGEISDEAKAALTDPRTRTERNPDGELYSPTDIVKNSGVGWQTMVRHKDPIVDFNEPEHTRELRADDKIVISRDKLIKREGAVTRAEDNLALAKVRTKEEVVERQQKRTEDAIQWKEKLTEKDSDGNYVYNHEYIREHAKAKVDAAKETHAEIKRIRNVHGKLETATANRDKAEAELKAFKDADIKRGAKGQALAGNRIAQRERTLQNAVDKEQAKVDSLTDSISYSKSHATGKVEKGVKANFTQRELEHAAQKVKDAEEDQVRADRKADRLRDNPENERKKLTTQADKTIAQQRKRLANYIREPEEARLAEIHNAEETLKTAKQQRDDVAKSYAFLTAKKDLDRPAGDDNKLNLASKVDVPDDPQNLYNLHYGDGPIIIYFEGSQKTWAGVQKMREEFPNAAVIGVGSVDGWEHSNLGKMIAEHGHDRQTFGVFDSDIVNNKSVQDAANAAGALVMRNGAKSFDVAAPGLDSNSDIRVRKLRSGATEYYKGADDAFGGGDTLASFPTRSKETPSRDRYGITDAEWSQPTANGGTRAGKTKKAVEDLHYAMARNADEDGYLVLSRNRMAGIMEDIGAGGPISDSRQQSQIDALIELGKIRKIDRYDEQPDGSRVPNPDAEELVKKGVIGPLSDEPYGPGYYDPSPVYQILDPALRPKNVTGTIGSRIAEAEPSSNRDGYHRVSEAGLAYWESVYGRQFQVGDIIPFGDLPPEAARIYEGRPE